MLKIEFEQIWSDAYAHIMDSGSNRLYTTFPNIIAFISAVPHQKIFKKHFLDKNHIFLDRKCAPEGRNLIQ